MASVEHQLACTIEPDPQEIAPCQLVWMSLKPQPRSSARTVPACRSSSHSHNLGGSCAGFEGFRLAFFRKREFLPPLISAAVPFLNNTADGNVPIKQHCEHHTICIQWKTVFRVNHFSRILNEEVCVCDWYPTQCASLHKCPTEPTVGGRHHSPHLFTGALCLLELPFCFR